MTPLHASTPLSSRCSIDGAYPPCTAVALNFRHTEAPSHPFLALLRVTLISSTPLSLFLFAATLTPASPPVRRFPSSFSAYRLIHHLSSNFATHYHRSSPGIVSVIQILLFLLSSYASIAILFYISFALFLFFSFSFVFLLAL
ncbi:hypothetical protein AHAS_Ahas13G0336000 [Arachis hypogaea]